VTMICLSSANSSVNKKVTLGWFRNVIHGKQYRGSIKMKCFEDYEEPDGFEALIHEPATPKMVRYINSLCDALAYPKDSELRCPSSFDVASKTIQFLNYETKIIENMFDDHLESLYYMEGKDAI